MGIIGEADSNSCDSTVDPSISKSSGNSLVALAAGPAGAGGVDLFLDGAI